MRAAPIAGGCIGGIRDDDRDRTFLWGKGGSILVPLAGQGQGRRKWRPFHWSKTVNPETVGRGRGIGAASGEAGLGDWVQFSRRRNQDYFGPVAWQFSMAHLVAALPLDPVVVGALVPAATAFGRRSWSGRRLRRGLCCIRRPFRLFGRAVTPAVVAYVLIHPTFISAPEHLLAFGGGL